MITGEGPWLSPRTVTGLELNTELLSDVFREYRHNHGISQADLAQLLNFDQTYISKIETGQRQVRDVEGLLHIAQKLDISPTRLGISNDLLRPIAPPTTAALVGAVDLVEQNQTAWCATRRSLNRTRGRLARTAAELYQRRVRLGGVPLMAERSWVPPQPVPLTDITLEWSDDATGTLITGGEPEAAAVLPLRAPGQRFARYTAAIRYLDPPTLFENRPSYRLLGIALNPEADQTPRLRFGLATYFDKLDVSEAIAHELAQAPGAADGTAPPWTALPLRALLGEPFDLGRRYVMPAIETLTLRRDRGTGAASFLLHWRDPAKVATAGGIYGLIPAGEFQPASIATHDRRNDFDLFRSIAREYSEEILGEPERDGSAGEPLDYDAWPLYRDLQAARDQGRLRVYCLGVGLDTLTLTATILTVAVYDDDLFDHLFGSAVRINAEGILITAANASKVTDGLPFTSETVNRLLQHEPLASPGAYIIGRAWQLRDHLLAR